MAEAMQVDTIDQNLYSRQIGAYGLETMGKLVKMKVLISGLRGLGVETAKNLILAGPNAVTLHDDAVVEARDLGANFYLTEADVGKKTRAATCYSKLAELNPYVSVNVHSGPLSPEFVKGFHVVVISEAPRKQLVELNNFCRSQSPPIGFITAEAFGLAASVFVDYGDAFICRDKDGEEPKSCIINAITQENPGTVHVHTDKLLPFQDGDHVSFREVQGMTELNGPATRPIKVTGKYSFTIEDTSKYGAYLREGIVEQVKVPTTIAFNSYEHSCLHPRPDNRTDLAVPDFAKFGRSEQLHLATQAVQHYRDAHGHLPRVRDAAAVAECLATAKKLNEAAKAAGETACAVEEVEETVVRTVVEFAACQISPLAALIGGVVAQEVVKFTGKYHPLRQWLYMDAFECQLPTPPTDCQLTGSRYDDQIAIFGRAFQERLAGMKLFLVGAGALGCEFLKSFALMGCCTTANGKLTVTDMDRIEVSNLNRQFLFRKEHVGAPKSRTAGQAAREMNAAFKVETLEVRVGPDTEATFNDDFWEGLDIIVNALDNVQARLYVDSRCVWYGKPLLESGTLGTKANAQVVLPHLTQSYGDSQDPPEESIPMCTLKHFPHAIEHTLEWSRDVFQGLFSDGPQAALTFLKDPAAYLAKLPSEGTPAVQRERLERIKQLLASSSNANIEGCVTRAVRMFEDLFDHQIAQLLHTFPLDHVTSDGQPFWSGPKRPPAPLKFDVNDPVHLGFILACTNLFAYNLNLPNADPATVKKIASGVKLEPFKPKQLKIKVDDKDTTVEGAGDDDTLLANLMKELGQIDERTRNVKLSAADFEKDDDSNFHIDFITACANLRARNYKIPEADRHKCKMIAGKIIPAIATTTAMVTGMVSLELLKIATLKDRKLEDFKNAFANLALPLWLFSEPLPPNKTNDKDYDPIAGGAIRAKPKGFTPWDKVDIKIPNATLKQLTDHLLQELGVEVVILSVGNACLYNAFMPAHKKRLAEPVFKIWQDITKSTPPPGRNYLIVEASCSDPNDGVDVVIPSIKLTFA